MQLGLGYIHSACRFFATIDLQGFAHTSVDRRHRNSLINVTQVNINSELCFASALNAPRGVRWRKQRYESECRVTVNFSLRCGVSGRSRMLRFVAFRDNIPLQNLRNALRSTPGFSAPQLQVIDILWAND